MDILMEYISFFCRIFHFHMSWYTQTSPPIYPSMVFLLNVSSCNLNINSLVLRVCVTHLDSNVCYISSLRSHFHHICCSGDQSMDILMEYTFSFCRIFHLHISCYRQSNPPIHPSMVFLLRVQAINNCISIT